MEREVLTIILSVRLVNTMVLFLFSPPSPWTVLFPTFFVCLMVWVNDAPKIKFYCSSETIGRHFYARKGQTLILIPIPQ